MASGLTKTGTATRTLFFGAGTRGILDTDDNFRLTYKEDGTTDASSIGGCTMVVGLEGIKIAASSSSDNAANTHVWIDKDNAVKYGTGNITFTDDATLSAVDMSGYTTLSTSMDAIMKYNDATDQDAIDLIKVT